KIPGRDRRSRRRRARKDRGAIRRHGAARRPTTAQDRQSLSAPLRAAPFRLLWPTVPPVRAPECAPANSSSCSYVRLPFAQRKISLCKSLRQFPPAYLPALVHRNLIEKENPLRHLPAAQPRATKFQELAFAKIDICHHAGRDLFISLHRFSPEHNHFAHAAAFAQTRFDLRRIHFFARNIDEIGSTPDDFESVAATRE